MELWPILACALVGLNIAIASQTALLIVDVQDCFLPGGSLAVTHSEQVFYLTHITLTPAVLIILFL